MLKIAAYHSPTTLAEAATLLAEEGRIVIAGGTDLLVNPRYMVGVREVVDIRKLGLDYIREENGENQIGKRVRREKGDSGLLRLKSVVIA